MDAFPGSQNEKGRARRHKVKRDIDQSIMSTTPAEKMREAGVKARETAEALLRAVMIGDLVSLRLADEVGVDPADISAIEEFKRRTAGDGEESS